MTGKIVIKNFDDFKSYLGKEIIVSDYIEITQERVNQFAEATSDYQWIHLDKERAKKETPFGGTIAHGYLTMCLAPYFISETMEFSGLKMGINYSLEKMKLTQPVRVGAKLRMRAHLIEIKNLRGTVKATLRLRFEMPGIVKPACTAEVTYLYQFE